MHVKVLSTQEVMSYPGFDELIEEYSCLLYTSDAADD